MTINPLTSPSAGAPALIYGDVNTASPSPGEVKGLIQKIIAKSINSYSIESSPSPQDFKAPINNKIITDTG